ncbi:MAG: dihydroorotate dehydrogenase-like protein [Acidimicrobiia bacterium]|nr:dihydroorotate dehydrogenase-like protein [Acidimicrobiia bacterium]
MNLETSYLGMTLSSPLVVAASPLGRRLGNLRRLEEAGAAALVLPSLFEEQIEHDSYQTHAVLEAGAGVYQEAARGYLPEAPEGYVNGSDRYLALLGEARQALKIPVIASLNGASTGGWVEYAHKMEDAGASALELNVYFVAADPDETGEQVERRYLDLVAAVRGAVQLPLAVKVGAYFSSMANMARRLVAAGADGLVLFNRFYQPDIDIEDLKVRSNVELSSSAELRLPLRWIAILKGRVEASLAATTGVHTTADVLKLVMAGADVAMSASALLRHGPDWLTKVRAEMAAWMEEHEYESVEQMKGSMSQRAADDPAAFERANYMETLITYATPTL